MESATNLRSTPSKVVLIATSLLLASTLFLAPRYLLGSMPAPRALAAGITGYVAPGGVDPAMTIRPQARHALQCSMLSTSPSMRMRYVWTRGSRPTSMGRPDVRMRATTSAPMSSPTFHRSPRRAAIKRLPSEASVTLDGSASYDANGDTGLTYGWTQTGGPAMTLSNSTAVSLTFTLAVTDSLGLADPTPDEVVITVQAAVQSVYLPLAVRQP